MRVHDVLVSLGLPKDTIDLIRSGQLVEEVERVQRNVDAVNAQLDAFEALHPEQAAALPWYDSRQAWKAAGRPVAPWWDLLNMRVRPVRIQEVMDVYPEFQNAWYWKITSDPDRYEKYRAHRRKSERELKRRTYDKTKKSTSVSDSWSE